jgi:hypothetical protein
LNDAIIKKDIKTKFYYNHLSLIEQLELVLKENKEIYLLIHKEPRYGMTSFASLLMSYTTDIFIPHRGVYMVNLRVPNISRAPPEYNSESQRMRSNQ